MHMNSHCFNIDWQSLSKVHPSPRSLKEVLLHVIFTCHLKQACNIVKYFNVLEREHFDLTACLVPE